MQSQSVLVVGVGGLGKSMVQEAVERGLRVSVLVRDQGKLEAQLDDQTLAALSTITVGDATDAAVLDEAMAGTNVVLSGRGADPDMARELAAAAKRNGVAKLCWPGGTTNVLADDGVTPNYQVLRHLGDWVDTAYRVHGACIETIRETGIDYVIFCPGRMASTGRRSADVASSLRVNRDAGPFVSYEDAAWVMLEAATTSTYDRKLVSAATAA